MVSLTAGKNVGEKRDPEETAEEKKQRKTQIKRDKKVRNTPRWSPLRLPLCPPVLARSPTRDHSDTVRFYTRNCFGKIEKGCLIEIQKCAADL